MNTSHADLTAHRRSLPRSPGSTRRRFGAGLLVLAVRETVCAEGNPGLEPYTPNRIEWLALVCNDQLRREMTAENHFSLNVVQIDLETLLIVVRYLPDADRKTMSAAIATAHKIIDITVKSHGWDDWVKVQERVEAVGGRKNRRS